MFLEDKNNLYERMKEMSEIERWELLGDMQNRNIIERAKLLQKAELDINMQKALILQCTESYLFFVNYFLWTYNPRLIESTLPFITYPFQDDYSLSIIDDIKNGHDSITEKSRDMGVSWQFVGIAIWGFLFHGWAGLYGSYKEDYVDSQGNLDSFFERCRFVLSKLPKWMKPQDLIEKYMSISSKELGSDIAGDSGQNFGTGGRRKWVMLDEYSYWQYDEKAFRKTKDVTNCRIFAGTPEGRYNVYGKIMTNHPDYKHLSIKKYSLHWKLHPLKTEEWYEREKASRTKEDVARELDISYDESVSGAVYKDFKQLVKFEKVEHNPNWKIYTSWDFGLDTTAIIWWQKDPETNQLYVFDTYSNKDKDIEFYVPFITGKEPEGEEYKHFEYTEEERLKIFIHSQYKGEYIYHFGDPYNANSRSVVTQNTIVSQLSKHGIRITTNLDENKTDRSTINDRINKAKLCMRRMTIDINQTDFIQCIQQARYPQRREGSQNTEENYKPIHDGTSHFRTSMEYFCDNEDKIMTAQRIIDSSNRTFDPHKLFAR